MPQENSKGQFILTSISHVHVRYLIVTDLMGVAEGEVWAKVRHSLMFVILFYCFSLSLH